MLKLHSSSPRASPTINSPGGASNCQRTKAIQPLAVSLLTLCPWCFTDAQYSPARARDYLCVNSCLHVHVDVCTYLIIVCIFVFAVINVCPDGHVFFCSCECECWSSKVVPLVGVTDGQGATRALKGSKA